jgi:hypothetical protein
MLRPLIIILVIVVALLRGGSMRNFAALRLRWIPLVVAGLVLQVLIFTPFTKTSLIPIATVPLYLLSMALLTIWVALNWRIPGMALIATGLLMNVAAIAANGGYMPVSPDSARIAGRLDRYATTGLPLSNNSIATEENVRLWLLTDIIPVPKEVPFANVFSIGDILLEIGIGVLCYRTIRQAPKLKPAIVEQRRSQVARAVPGSVALTVAPTELARRLRHGMSSLEYMLDRDISTINMLTAQLSWLNSRYLDATQLPPTLPEKPSTTKEQV